MKIYLFLVCLIPFVVSETTELPIGRVPQLEVQFGKMKECHLEQNTTIKTTCLQDKIQAIESIIYSHSDEKEMYLSGTYYLQIALSNPRSTTDERERLEHRQDEWSQKRKNIIDFLLDTFKSIYSNQTTTE